MDTVKILRTDVEVRGFESIVTQRIEMRDEDGVLHNDGVTVVTIFETDDTGEGYAPEIKSFHFICEGPDGVAEIFDRPAWGHFEDICTYQAITHCALEAILK